MKRIPLTPAQRKVIKLIKKTDGAMLRNHRKSTGTVCYRLMDKEVNPVANLRRGVVDKLINKEYLVINGGVL